VIKIREMTIYKLRIKAHSVKAQGSVKHSGMFASINEVSKHLMFYLYLLAFINSLLMAIVDNGSIHLNGLDEYTQYFNSG